MSDNKFPTQGQIERRADEIVNGCGLPYLPDLPGIMFRRLTGAEKGESSRAYSRYLKEDMSKGGRFSSDLLMTELRRRCLEVGLNYDDLLVQEETFQKRIFENAPPELRDAAPKLIEEETAAMDAEARNVYLGKRQERGRQVKEFLDEHFTAEEKIIRGQIQQVKNLQDSLQLHTYEYQAKRHMFKAELLLGARQETDPATPYFANMEALDELEDTAPALFVALVGKWREFKEGRWPGFMRRSSSTPGTGTR